MRTSPPPPCDDLRFSYSTGILQKKTMWFIGVELEPETSAPPPKKYPGSAPGANNEDDVPCVVFESKYYLAPAQRTEVPSFCPSFTFDNMPSIVSVNFMLISFA